MSIKNLELDLFENESKEIEFRLSSLLREYSKNKIIEEEVIYEKFSDLNLNDEELNSIIDKIEKSGYEVKQIDLDDIDTDLDELSSVVTNPTLKNDYLTKNAVSNYLMTIGKYKLLTKEEEVELAKRIEKGDKDAREKLLNSNLRLVIKFARKYNKNVLPFSDLIDAGNLGLIRATETFDYKLNNRFSTYASRWIMQSIQRALDNKARTVRIPVHLAAEITILKRCEKELAQEGITFPSTELLFEKMKEKGCKTKSASEVANLQRFSLETVSLEAPTKEDENSTTGDFIADDKVESPEEYSNHMLQHEILDQLMDEVLNKSEKEVIVLRYGFNGGKPMTLQEISVIRGLTKERIRQIQQSALNKMRKNMNNFRPFLSA